MYLFCTLRYSIAHLVRTYMSICLYQIVEHATDVGIILLETIYSYLCKLHLLSSFTSSDARVITHPQSILSQFNAVTATHKVSLLCYYQTF